MNHFPRCGGNRHIILLCGKIGKHESLKLERKTSLNSILKHLGVWFSPVVPLVETS